VVANDETSADFSLGTNKDRKCHSIGRRRHGGGGVKCWDGWR
jgi:hypothetical protein